MLNLSIDNIYYYCSTPISILNNHHETKYINSFEIDRVIAAQSCIRPALGIQHSKESGDGFECKNNNSGKPGRKHTCRPVC